MRKIGEVYLDQGKMWQDVVFEDGDDMSNGQFKSGDVWVDDTGNWGRKSTGGPSIYKRRIPVENKVQQNAKKNLHLLKEMLLNKAKIVKRSGTHLYIVNYPSDLLKDGEFFEINGETNEWLYKGNIGPDKYAIFEALAEGKQVQFDTSRGWEDFNYFSSNCHFDAMNYLYRIKEEIPDTVIKWTSVSEPPADGRTVHVLYKSGSIHTVEYWDGLFVNSTNVKGWSYV